MSSNSQRVLKAMRVAACLLGATMMPGIVGAAESEAASKLSSVETGGHSTLSISTSKVDFGAVTPGETESAIVVFTHTGPPDSGQINIKNLFLDEVDSKLFTLSTNSNISLSPAESFELVVGFEPDKAGSMSGSLLVTHTGKSGVDHIELYGEGVYRPVLSAAEPVSLPFGKSSLAGFPNDSPTSLQFGPDGKLYVASMYGDIHVLDIERKGANDYEVTDKSVISLVRKITNHNDDGSIKPNLNKRLVTGLLVTGTASKPVIYVLSSDPRIGGGSSGETTNLDTNSGILSRLSKTSSGWKKLDLVRGFPRSEENHHGNGMALQGSTLYITAGGNTNMGAPSNNFAMLPEYALSAAILSIDLDAIGENTYDLPTLDDEDRSGPNDSNDPFGGNRGKNQAMLVEGGPVQVYAPGFRNPYDVVIMQNGRMYSWDNGPNSGWGGAPGNCLNNRSEPGNTQHDALHLISDKGYYGGHPNPTRGSQQNTFNKKNPQSPVPYNNSVECFYYGPGTNGNGKNNKNFSLVSLPRSTNGMAEYTASNLSGALAGDLLAASWDNKIYRVSFTASGQLEDMNVLFSNVGTSPLDVTAQADNAAFPGTIWVADFRKRNIAVYEPDDYEGGGGNGACNASNAGDADQDGFSNYDELANGTDGCSAADFPADADGDSVSDLIDSDDDNDGIADVNDPFATDPANGADTTLPVDYQWENDSDDAGFIANLGFSGLMTNGEDSYQTQFDLNEMTIIGAAGVVTVDSVPKGDPLRQNNSQQYGFQFGVDVDSSSEMFRVQTRILAPFSGFQPKLHQSMGLFIGNGDQDNYAKLVIKYNGTQFLSEVEGNTYYDKQTVFSNLTDADYVDLTIEVDPASAIATAFIQTSRNDVLTEEVQVGSVDFPAAWLNGPTRLATGIISTSIGAQEFPATWDFMTVTPLGGVISNDPPSVEIATVGEVTTGEPVLISAMVSHGGLPDNNASVQWSLMSGPATAVFDDSTQGTTSVTFSEVGDYILLFSATDGNYTVADTTSVTVKEEAVSGGNVVYRINAGGPQISATDGNWLSDSASSDYFNTGMTWKTSAGVDVSDLNSDVPAALFQSERYDKNGGPELEWKLPVTPGEYVVKLYFAEIYFGTMKLGGRVFNVNVEGQSATGIDVFASVGANKAMMKSFTVQSDDTLNILLTRTTQNPAIKGIEVLRYDDSSSSATNKPPVVSAGSSIDATVAEPIALSGVVSDDGLPSGVTTLGWSLVSGPGMPQFVDNTDPASQVVFPVSGDYVLKLNADDGVLSASAQVQVTVAQAQTLTNKAPVVSAGPDVDAIVNTPLTLSGSVTDDGLPGNSTALSWVMLSGQGSVAFSDAGSTTTTASFTQAGEYVLRLSATDSELESFDEVTITVSNEPVASSTVYRINAGGPSISDVNGDWASDMGSASLANTGNTYTKKSSIDTSATPAIPDAVFQSERWDRKGGAAMNWKLPVTPGTYDVHLYFSEIFSGAMGNGKRVFNVSVEGQSASSLDVFAEAGAANTSIVRSFAITTTDGFIDIVFQHIKENPAIKGIEVVATGQ